MDDDIEEEKENIEDLVRDILEEDKDLIEGLQSIDTEQRVFIVLKGGETIEDFSVLVLDATTENTKPHVCTVISAGLLDVLNTSCEDVLARGIRYIENKEREERQQAVENKVVSLDAYRETTKKDFTLPATITKTLIDDQLEIQFSFEDSASDTESDNDHAS